MATITFKEPFESKLKKLKIKTKFIHNIRKHCTGSDTLQKRIQKLNNKPDWDSFIMGAFIWMNSPEGPLYWVKTCKL